MSPTLSAVLTVSVAVIAASCVFAVILFIPVVLQIRRVSRETEKLIDTVRLQVAPVSRDLTAISRDLRGILQSIQRQVDKVEDGVTTARDIVVRVQDFERAIEQTIEEPLLKAVTLVSAMTRGFEAFFRVLRR
jgi:uncharacterized protein YoxC